MRALARPVLRHRILLNFQAQSERVTTDQVVDRLLDAVPVPRVRALSMSSSARDAAPGTRFLDPTVLARIGDLELLARTVVDGFMHGLHRSPRSGSRWTSPQHRPYMPGDDLRRIDWRVFGRTDRFYVKEYEADTNATRVAAARRVRARCRTRAAGSASSTTGAFLAACLAWFSRASATGSAWSRSPTTSWNGSRPPRAPADDPAPARRARPGVPGSLSAPISQWRADHPARDRRAHLRFLRGTGRVRDARGARSGPAVTT